MYTRVFKAAVSNDFLNWKSINNSVRCIQGFWKRAFCNTAINNYHFEFILYNMIHYINKLVELQLQHCQTAPRWRINQHILQIHLLTLSQGALCQLMEHLCISPRTQCLLWATNSWLKYFYANSIFALNSALKRLWLSASLKANVAAQAGAGVCVMFCF